jgi:O-antigen/teichoic acid export membrane protein
VLAAGVALLSLGYALLLWLERERVYAQVLHRQDAGRDTLLLLWTAIVLVTGLRDQLAGLVSAQARFRALTLLTTASALAALAVGWWALHRLGVPGALVGLLTGECLSLLGVAWLGSRPAGNASA